MNGSINQRVSELNSHKWNTHPDTVPYTHTHIEENGTSFLQQSFKLQHYSIVIWYTKYKIYYSIVLWYKKNISTLQHKNMSANTSSLHYNVNTCIYGKIDPQPGTSQTGDGINEMRVLRMNKAPKWEPRARLLSGFEYARLHTCTHVSGYRRLHCSAVCVCCWVLI